MGGPLLQSPDETGRKGQPLEWQADQAASKPKHVCMPRVMRRLASPAQNESDVIRCARVGRVKVATGIGATELAAKMTWVVDRHRTLLRPPWAARWGNS